MTRRQLDTEQARHLETARRAAEQYNRVQEAARADLEAEREAAQERYDERIEADRVALGVIVAEAYAAGVPMTQIAELALGVSTPTAYKLKALGNKNRAQGDTRRLSEVTAEFAHNDDGTILVTPTEADVQKYAEHAGVAPDAYPNASFRLTTTDEGDTYPEAVTPAVTDEGIMHPVVALVQRDPQYAARVVEWGKGAAA